jgi:hypothetical protein
MNSFLTKILSSVIIFSFAFTNQSITVSGNDFKPAFGDWKGSLTYLDYTSGKPYTMPANVSIQISSKNNNEIIFSYQYPNEPKANGNDTLAIKEKGTMIDNSKIIARKNNADGSLQIETERNGKDGNQNKDAVIKHIYIISKNNFISRKEVKFMDDNNWIKRNEYLFSR